MAAKSSGLAPTGRNSGNPAEEESFSLNWMNSLTWKERGNDLYLLPLGSSENCAAFPTHDAVE